MMCQAWNAQWALIELLLASASTGLTGPTIVDSSEAAEAVPLATVCIKVFIRNIFVFTMTGSFYF